MIIGNYMLAVNNSFDKIRDCFRLFWRLQGKLQDAFRQRSFILI
jgi:hypothetical protein